MENPIKMDDLGVPLFSETSKSIQVTLRPFSRAIRSAKRASTHLVTVRDQIQWVLRLEAPMTEMASYQGNTVGVLMDVGSRP